MKRTNDLGHDPVFRLVCKLAIPTMLAQLVSVLYSIVDRIYIGNIPQIGDLALAGVGVCGPIVTLLSSFASLVGLGGSPILAMRMGEGNRKELSNSFFMLLVLSVGLTGLFLLLKGQLLQWFGASQATFGYADTYLTIYTAGTFFALMATGMNSFLIAQGFSGLGMATVMLGAVLNIVLDPIFIFVLKLDVAGAAPGYGHSDAGGGAQYCAGPHFYLCFKVGCGGCGSGYGHLPDGLLRLRALLSAAEKDAGAPAMGRL